MNRRRELRIASEASLELANAARWYEEQRRGLGVEFLNSVEATLEAVRRTPMLFRVVYKDVRRALLKRFPFGVYFREGEENIDILSVFHTKRDPKSLKDRM